MILRGSPAGVEGGVGEESSDPSTSSPQGPPGLPGLKGDSGPKGEKVRQDSGASEAATRGPPCLGFQTISHLSVQCPLLARDRSWKAGNVTSLCCTGDSVPVLGGRPWPKGVRGLSSVPAVDSAAQQSPLPFLQLGGDFFSAHTDLWTDRKHTHKPNSSSFLKKFLLILFI